MISRLLTLFLCLLPLLSLRAAVLPEGFLDVTTRGADPTGVIDSTSAIQTTINEAREVGQAVWFPPGTYRISDRLEAQRMNGRGNVLIGSTVDPNRPATLVLDPGSAGFQNPERPRVMLHFFNAGTADNESNTAGQFNQGAIGLHFKVGANNPGAAAVRLQGAEGCTLQDLHIDLREGGHIGILGVPGSGGSTHGVTVLGGNVGIDTRRPPALAPGGSQPTPVITGATLIGQRDVALHASSRGALVMVGSHLEPSGPGPAIRITRHWEGQPFDSSVVLVDCIIRYPADAPAGTVVDMTGPVGRSFAFENVFVENAARVWPGLEARPDGWMQFRRAAVHIQPTARPWGQPAEPVYVDGTVFGDIYLEARPVAAPPPDLHGRHRLPVAFPTWESAGAVDVTTLGAVGDGATNNADILQAAIDAHDVLFFPKGTFMVSRTLDLRPESKLIGIYHTFSVIQALASLENRFAGTTAEDPDEPIVRTADTRFAETWLAFLQIKRTYPLANHNATPVGNYALEWRSGGNSLLRMVEVESRPSRNYLPSQAAANFWGLDIIANPIDSFHPQRSFPDGMWAWPNGHPNVVVRGNGGGRWFNFWFHGRQALREDTPFLLVEGTEEPLHIYHLHMQQQDSRNHGEFRNAANISIYGTKAEIKGTLAYFENCRNVRLFGNGGLTSPDPAYNPPYLFRFINTHDFVIGGLGDTINEGPDNWIGGAFDRWIHANVETWFPLQDANDERAAVVVPSAHRPILYLRGEPAYVQPSRPTDATLGLWAGAYPADTGLFYLEWFGFFAPATDGWIHHREHGWLFTDSPSTEALWLWSPASGWLFTAPALYPFLYHAGSGSWLYYLEGGTPAHRFAYDFATRAWISL